MNEIEFDKLKQTLWRRPLTEPENSALNRYLATHPGARAEWEGEFALAQTLRQMPDVPVSSNFTRLVMQAVERENARPVHGAPRFSHWLRRHWLRTTALASLLVCAGLAAGQQYRSLQRMNMAQGVSAVSQAAAFPQQWLVDFDAINRFDQPPVDNELLAALQ